MAKTCVKVVGRIIFIELGLGINALITEKYMLPSDIYLFKVNNGNNKTMCEICPKITTKTPERRYSCPTFQKFWKMKLQRIKNLSPKR